MKKFAMTASLAAVAALALMAMVGVSAASAKVCSTSGSTVTSCGAGHGTVMGKGQKIVATLNTPSVATLTSGFIVVTCGESTVEGEITDGEAGTGDITNMTFKDCHSNINQTSGSCTATTTASSTNKWAATTAATGGGSGTMSVSSVTGTFVCNAGIFGTVTCRYTTSNATVTVNGNDTKPTVVATKVPLEREATSSSSCSPTSEWDGTYTVTTPTSIFIT